jgi:hypothetical protein
MQIIITEHIRKPGRGWLRGRQAPATDPHWSAGDKLWINQLVESGDTVLTVGDTMYQAQLVRGEVAS